MASPLAGSLAKTIGKAFASTFLDATLTKDVPGSGGDPWDPPATTPVNYACKAIPDQYGVGHRQGGLVQAGDQKILILANSLASGIVPEPLNRITIRSETLVIVPQGEGQPSVMTDPARAVWECRCRK